jgi:hypothetical protein
MSRYAIQHSKKEGVIEIHASGNLIINHIEKIHADLRGIITADDSVTICIDDPENIDITFVQEVISIRKTVLSRGKEFKVTATLKDDLSQLIEKAGLLTEIK